MQQISGALPGQPESTFSQVIGDFVSTNGASWSKGASLIQPLTAQPTLSRPWTVYGWGLQGKGLLFQPALGGQFPAFGKLGSLFAALLVGGSISPLSTGHFSQPPGNATPTLVKVWDGDTDPPFPFAPSNVSAPPDGGFFQTVQQLPQPVTLNAGDQMGIGLWLSPMLVSAQLEIQLYNVTYLVNYQ